MKTRLRLLLFVLAVPLLAALIASASRDRWEERWSAGLQREFRAFGHRAGAAVMARYSLGSLCGDARRAAGIPPCRTYNHLSRVILAGAGTSALGVLWIGLVAGAGAVARRRKPLGFAAFRPAVYVSAGVLVILLAAQGVLAVQGVSAAGRLLFPGTLLRSLGSGAGLLAALLIGLSAAQAVRTARRMGASPYVFGLTLPEGDAAGLRAAIGRLCAPHQSPPAFALVAGLAPAVFVSPGAVNALDGRRVGPVLHFPLTLARILTVPECEALLAAQLSRVRDEDARSAARFSSRWLRLHEEAARLQSGPLLARAALFPAAWWLAFVLDAFEPAAGAAWREEEAEGDLAAIAATGGEAYGAALVKVHAFAPAWEAALRAMTGAVAEGEQYANVSLLFAEIVAGNADAERIEWAIARLADVAEGGRRFGLARAGGPDPVRVAVAALDVRPAVAATTLIGEGAVRLEEDLSDVRHQQLRQ